MQLREYECIRQNSMIRKAKTVKQETISGKFSFSKRMYAGALLNHRVLSHIRHCSTSKRPKSASVVVFELKKRQNGVYLD